MDLTRFFLNRLCNSFIPKTIGKAMGTHKNKKKKIGKTAGRSSGR